MTRTEKLSVGFLFDDTLDSTAGVSQYVRALGAWLSQQGHHVCYLVGDTKMRQWQGDPVYSLSKNLKVKFNANWLSTPLPSLSSPKINAALQKEKLDVLHVQVPYSPLMAQRVINRAAPTTAVIGTFHILPAGRLADYGTRLLRIIYGGSLKRFDRLFGVSPAAAKFAARTLGVVADVSPDVFDYEVFAAARTKRPTSNQRLIFMGRLVDRKGAKQLLLAFHKIHSRHPKLKLTLAGAGPQMSWLQKYVADNQLQAVVDFPGFIDEDKKAGLLAQADIACFPSLYGESFGISLLEAMAAGAGVVLGGDNPGYRTILGAQPKSLVNAQEPDRLAARLEELLSNQRLAKQLHDWQAEHVRQFDVAVVGPQMVDNYHQAIAKRRASQ